MNDIQELIDAVLKAFPDESSIYLHSTELEDLLHSINKFLRQKNWHIIINPEFYKTGINYNVRIIHYNPKYKVEENDFQDISTYTYGDNGEFDTYEEALHYGILWCLNIIVTGKTYTI